MLQSIIKEKRSSFGHMYGSSKINNPFLQRRGPICRMHNEMCMVRRSTSIFEMVIFANYMYCKFLNFLKTKGPICGMYNKMCIVRRSTSISKRSSLSITGIESSFNFFKTNGARFEGMSLLMTSIAQESFLLSGI